MNIISDKERYLLLFVTTTISYLVFVNFVKMYNFSVAEHQQDLLHSANGGVSFGIYCLSRASLIPLADVLSFFLVFLIYYSRNFIFSTLFTVIPLLMFVSEFERGINNIIAYREDFPSRPIDELMLMVASVYDYGISILLSLVFLWQLSIIVRFIIRSFQAKIYLR
jgi:hypothetical protein